MRVETLTYHPELVARQRIAIPGVGDDKQHVLMLGMTEFLCRIPLGEMHTDAALWMMCILQDSAIVQGTTTSELKPGEVHDANVGELLAQHTQTLLEGLEEDLLLLWCHLPHAQTKANDMNVSGFPCTLRTCLRLQEQHVKADGIATLHHQIIKDILLVPRDTKALAINADRAMQMIP